MNVICRKCGSECEVDTGDFPKFTVWCDTCEDYADVDYTDVYSDLIEQAIEYSEEL